MAEAGLSPLGHAHFPPEDLRQGEAHVFSVGLRSST